MNLAPYSASKINCYLECPAKFKFKYIDKAKIKFIPKKFFEKGKFIHYALQHYPNMGAKEFKFKLSDGHDIAEYMGQLQSILRQKKVKALITTKDVNHRELSIRYHRDGVVYFRGEIDLIIISSNVIMIVDWKTGKNWSNSLSKDSPQVLMYAIWAFENYQDINTVETSYFYVESGEQVKCTYSRDNLPSYIDVLDGLVNRIETDIEYPTTVHKFCHYCDYQDLCPQQNKSNE